MRIYKWPAKTRGTNREVIDFPVDYYGRQEMRRVYKYYVRNGIESGYQFRLRLYNGLSALISILPVDSTQ